MTMQVFIVKYLVTIKRVKCSNTKKCILRTKRVGISAARAKRSKTVLKSIIGYMHTYSVTTLYGT